MDDCEHRVGARELAADERDKNLDVREQHLNAREQNIDAEVKQKADEMSLAARLNYRTEYKQKEEECEGEYDAWADKYGKILLIFIIYSIAVTILWATHSSDFRSDVVHFIFSIGMFVRSLFATTWGWAAAISGPTLIRIMLEIILRFVVPLAVLAAISTGVYFAGREYYRHCVDDTSLVFMAATMVGICFGADALHWFCPWINVIWTFWAAEGAYLLVRRMIQIRKSLYSY